MQTSGQMAADRQQPDDTTSWLSGWVAIAVAAAILMAMLIIAGLSLGQRHDSPVLHVGTEGCVLASPTIMDATELADSERRFQCNGYSIASDTRQLWLRIPMEKAHLPSGLLNLEGDSAPFTLLRIVHRDAAATLQSRLILPDDVMRAWTAGTRFSIPLTTAEGRSETLWLGIDRPWSRLAVNGVEIMSQQRAQTERFNRSLLFAIYLGLGVVPIIYSLAFFVALRYPFMMWHAAMASGFLLYTLCSSSLLFHFVPDLTLWHRMLASYSSLSVAVGLAGYFLLSFVERDILPKWVCYAVLGASNLLLANAVFIVFIGPYLPFLARNIYHAAYLPAIAAFLLAGIYGMKNGSRVIWFFAGGWILSGVAAIDRILRGLDVYLLPAEFDFSLYLCLAIEVIVTACGVAYRVMAIRRERDIARLREQELVRLADTDGLTGIANRRVFDAMLPKCTGGALIIADLDHFKQVNDHHGHHKGDELLRAIGHRLAALSAEEWCNSVYRLGGEEFALIINTGEPAQAMILADMVRLNFETFLWQDVTGLNRPATASFGVAMIDGTNPASAFNAADDALYRAKELGRNRAEMGNSALRITAAA
ncbi:MAG: diguanylate cyclase [Pseudomonadota bacterium]